MGFNIAGLLIKGKIESEKEIETLLGSSIKFSHEVSFEEASTSFRDDDTIDILQNENGTLIITELGQVYDLTNTQREAIQFMISDVSATYYFEKFANGQLVRKLITTEGEIAEDFGEGIISEDDEFLDKVWEFSNEYLQIDFMEEMFDLILSVMN